MKLFLSIALLLTVAQICFGVSLNTQWAKFKEENNKKYVDGIEEAFRKGVFAANLEKINKHNEEYDQGEHTWKMSVNLFADLTHDEFMEKLTLQVPDMPKSNQQYQMKAKSMASSVDWRDTGCVGAIKDQGSCGSCWAFGAVASVEFACCMASNNDNALSEQQVVDCDNRNSGCNGGWYDTAWQYMMEEGGLETSSDYPYTARGGSCKSDSNKFECTVTGCVGGPNNGACDNSGLVGDEEELKKMLNDQALAVAVDASPFQFYSSGILDCRNYHNLNHAVFAVGYEDGSHYTIKNSWGKSWGESGFVRVGMGGNPCGVADYPGYAIAE